MNFKTTRLLKYQILVFTLTFFGYAFYHTARKTLSSVKNILVEDMQLSQQFLGTLDTLFLGVYSIGLFFAGHFGDRYNLKIVLVIGMFASGLSVTAFGLAKYWQIYNYYYFAVVWGLGGLFQSSGWPCTVAIMENWFGEKARGSVFGIWSANASVGNIIGSITAGIILNNAELWPWVFFSAAIMIFVNALLICILMPSKPGDIGLVIEGNKENQSVDERATLLPVGDGTAPLVKKPINFFRAWLIPGVALYSFSYAFLKLVNYAFWFWLPFYLETGLHYDSSFANLLSTLYDVGGIISGIAAGFLTDYLLKKYGIGRAMVMVPMILLSVPVLYCYRAYGYSAAANGTLMFIAGVLQGGPGNIISSAISADLGTHPAIKGSAEAIGTVTGIVDGTGSVGAAGGQYLVAWISDRFGWDPTFHMLTIMSGLSGLCVITLFYKDCKIAWALWRAKRIKE